MIRASDLTVGVALVAFVLGLVLLAEVAEDWIRRTLL